ncbi:MAG: hypothetical protein NTY74_13620 [Ignavibacteriae bacterium]|nr:hypothetical protein [Ignavibacteriota bacterium]
MRKIVLLILIYFIYQISYGQNYLNGYGKSYPIEGKYDKSFNSFLKKLKTAIENYDQNYIYSIVDLDIDLGPESNGRGIWEFKSVYDLSDVNCVFWSLNKRVLSWGGSKSNYQNVFHFPSEEIWDKYSYLTNGVLSQNIFSIGIAIGDKVPVYFSPNENSNIEGYLNFEVVEIVNFIRDEWSKIQMANNKNGFVRKNDLYEFLGDYCIEFKKKNNKWVISLFCRTSI